jgi:hypothetical protein
LVSAHSGLARLATYAEIHAGNRRLSRLGDEANQSRGPTFSAETAAVISRFGADGGGYADAVG